MLVLTYIGEHPQCIKVLQKVTFRDKSTNIGNTDTFSAISLHHLPQGNPQTVSTKDSVHINQFFYSCWLNDLFQF